MHMRMYVCMHACIYMYACIHTDLCALSHAMLLTSTNNIHVPFFLSMSQKKVEKIVKFDESHPLVHVHMHMPV